MQRKDKRYYIRRDTKAHAGPTGLPKIRAGDGGSGVSRQTIGRRDQRQHTEIEKK
jgi:hypothetical protein